MAKINGNAVRISYPNVSAPVEDWLELRESLNKFTDTEFIRSAKKRCDGVIASHAADPDHDKPTGDFEDVRQTR